ncbi:hypothetical protein TWF281_002951 [Arthrobotrys megalospora]
MAGKGKKAKAKAKREKEKLQKLQESSTTAAAVAGEGSRAAERSPSQAEPSQAGPSQDVVADRIRQQVLWLDHQRDLEARMRIAQEYFLLHNIEHSGPLFRNLASGAPGTTRELTTQEKDELAVLLNSQTRTAKRRRDLDAEKLVSDIVTASEGVGEPEVGAGGVQAEACPSTQGAQGQESKAVHEPSHDCGGTSQDGHNNTEIFIPSPPSSSPPLSPSPLPLSSSPPRLNLSPKPPLASTFAFKTQFPENIFLAEPEAVARGYRLHAARYLRSCPKSMKMAEDKISDLVTTLKQVQENQNDEDYQKKRRAESKLNHAKFLAFVCQRAPGLEARARKALATPEDHSSDIPSSPGNDGQRSLEDFLTRRQEFVKEFLNAAPNFGETLFDAGASNDGKSVRMWLENGDIRWAVEDNKTVCPELATLKGRFSRTHDCTGDVHEFCLTCLMEMEWDDLLDFAPALGLPIIRRPRGWKPPFDEDVDVTSEFQESVANEDSSLILPSETGNLGTHEDKKEPEVTEALTQPQTGKKKKKNKKKKKKNANASVSQAGDEVKTAGPSSQHLSGPTPKPIQQSSTKPTSKDIGYPFATIPHISDGPDGKSVELEYITGPAAKVIQEQYKKFLPVAIPDEAVFKFSSEGQSEREISGKQMRAILTNELLTGNDPDFTTTVLQSYMTNANVEGSGSGVSSKRKENVTTKDSVASPPTTGPSTTKPKSCLQSSTAKATSERKPSSQKKKNTMTALEEYNALRAQRLELCLGIARFVLESISSGKRPFFDVSLDGRIEFGHSNLLYPIRMLRDSNSDSEEEEYGLPTIGIDPESTEIKLVTAPLVRIRDKETPDIGDGMDNIIREFRYPNLIAMQAMFRNVDMRNEDLLSSIDEEEVDIKGKGKAPLPWEEDYGNPVPQNTIFGLKASITKAKAKAKAGEPVFLGSQDYKILPTEGPHGQKTFENLRSLTTTFTRAMDMCEEVQTWVKNQKRNIALRDVLGDDPLWPVNPGIPRKPIDGAEPKPATKPAPTKPVPVKKPAAAAASTSTQGDADLPAKFAEFLKELEEKEEMAAMLTVERDETIALMKRFPLGRPPMEWGFDAHLKRMNECLEGIEANNRKVRAIIGETLRDHPWPPRDLDG